MKDIRFKGLFPHLLALLIFFVLGYLSFPALIEGKQVRQNDIVMWQGSAREIEQFREETGEEPLWTNSMFSGMPATMVSVLYEGNYLEPVYKALFWGERPASYMILAMLCFYLLMLAFGVNPWLSILGAVSFAFCAYNFQIIQAGHNTKFVAMAFMPAVLAAAVYAYRRKAFLGAVLFGVAVAFEVLANHVQVTYYLAMVLIFYGFSELVFAFRSGRFTAFLRTTALLIVFGLLGVAANVNHLWPAWEYTQYTMRGGSELTFDQEVQTGGLKTDYATSWSYGIDETLNLLIPNLKGGSSSGSLSQDSETYRLLKDNQVPNADQIIAQLPLYWGPQPSTAGPVYLGAIVVWLFVLGLLLVRGPMRGWVSGVILLALFLAWGKHMMWFTEFFMHYVPLYNKFRAVSIILVIVQMVVPLFGFYALHRLLAGDFEQKQVLNALKLSVGITGGICLLYALIPSLSGNFVSGVDASLPDWLRSALVEDRKELLRMDAFRSLFFVLLGAGVVWAGYMRKLSYALTVLLLGGFLFLDLRTVDARYLDSSYFVRPSEWRGVFSLRPVDEAILKDTDPDYRVLDLTRDVFNESVTSYYHKSIGGYSAAKLQRYQDIIEHHLVPELQSFASALQGASSSGAVDSAFRAFHVLNMLNTKYVVVHPESSPLLNPYAQGHAWFVGGVYRASHPDEEIMMLDSLDLRNIAVVDFSFDVEVSDARVDTVSAGSVNLVQYAPNRLEYRSSSSSDRVAVFSEIFYPQGWEAEIDGEPVPIYRANYLLRALWVPSGDHTLIFHYRPKSYSEGSKYSRFASGLLLLSLIGVGVYAFRLGKRRK